MVASADSQVRIISGRNVVHKYKGNASKDILHTLVEQEYAICKF